VPNIRTVKIVRQSDGCLVAQPVLGECQQCASALGCGLRAGASAVAWKHPDSSAWVGREATLILADGALFKAALIGYGLPLLTALTLSALGASWARTMGTMGAMGQLDADLAAVAGCVLGLVIGFALARFVSAPLVRVVDSDEQAVLHD
jgi:positive regulator of sigma E activity